MSEDYNLIRDYIKANETNFRISSLISKHFEVIRNEIRSEIKEAFLRKFQEYFQMRGYVVDKDVRDPQFYAIECYKKEWDGIHPDFGIRVRFESTSKTFQELTFGLFKTSEQLPFEGTIEDSKADRIPQIYFDLKKASRISSSDPRWLVVKFYQTDLRYLHDPVILEWLSQERRANLIADLMRPLIELADSTERIFE